MKAKLSFSLCSPQFQIDLTKQYWQTIGNEQRTTEEIEKLRKRIYLQRIPNKTAKTIDLSMVHI